MIEFTNIIIEGFCSIDSLELTLNTNKITIVRGPNGFGKSNLLSAIVWGIYGKNLKGVSDVNTWKKFRPKSYMGTKVELFFNKGNSVHKIVRCLEYKGEVEGAKGNNRLLYLIDADPVKEKTKPQLQALIEKNVGMSYNLFINTIMFGQGMKRLIQESGSDKKQLFEEIFDLGYLTKAKKIAQDKYNDLDKETFKVKATLDHENSLYDEQSSMLDDLRSRLKNKVSINNKELDSLVEAKNLAIKALNEIKPMEANRLKSKIDIRIKKVNGLLRDINDTLRIAKKSTNISLKDLIDDTISLIEGNNISEAILKLKDIKNSFDKIDECHTKSSDLNNRLHKLYDKKAEVSKLISKAENLEYKIKTLDKSISKIQEDNNTYDKSIIEKQETKLNDTRLRIDKLKPKYEALVEDRDIYKWVYTDPLGNKGIKVFLFESSLGYLNETLRSYSDILGFNIQFSVDLNSTKKDFETLITKDGVDVLYEELSGGEKQLANLAMAFAMNEVITNSKGTNIAFLDEVFESLSSDNIEVVVGLIRKVYKDRTLFLITHHDSLPIPNAKTLVVKKIKGLSSYEFQ